MFTWTNKATSAKNEIVIKDNIIHVTLCGKQTKALAEEALDQFKTAIAHLKSQDKKVYVWVDVRGMGPKDVTMESRLAMKEAFRQPFDALSAVGRSKLMEVAMYLINAGDAKSRARYFSSERKARKWLDEMRHPSHRRERLTLFCAAAVALIGITGLVGWVIDNVYMTSIWTTLRPINPLVCLGLLMVSLGLIGVWRRNKNIQLISALGIILLGGLALSPLGIDNALFGSKMEAVHQRTGFSDMAAVSFLAIGLILLIARSKRVWVIILREMIALALLIATLFSIFGLLYADDQLARLNISLLMSIPASLAFQFAGVGLILDLQRFKDRKRWQISGIGWAIFVVIGLVQSVTYLAWTASLSNNKHDAETAFQQNMTEIEDDIEKRIRAYVDGLYGYRGLFASSDKVDEAEFNAYDATVDLTNQYPGLRAISYISKVNEKDLPAFIAQRRQDKSFSPTSNANYNIQDKSSQQTHYLLTFVANSTGSAALGRDFAEDPVRRPTYQQAMDSDKPAVSKTLTFAPTAPGTPGTKGFFITMPLENKPPNKGAAKEYIGFVSAIFSYEDFFKELLGKDKVLDGLDLHIRDTSSGDEIFSSDRAKGSTAFSEGKWITVADQTWEAVGRAPLDFGTSDSQNSLPGIILLGGTGFSVLLLLVFVLQNQSRRRAVHLADSITIDLQHERNQAVAIQQKDDAILSSIGDAVFAIDPKGHLAVFNPSAQQLSGFTEKEALGKHYKDILRFEYEKDGAHNDKFIQKALSGKVASMDAATVLVRKDGKRISVADSAAPIRNLDGNITGAIVVFRDVTEQQALDKAKTEFVSLASHQLRTPLSAINWYAEMLLNGDAGKVNKEQYEYLKEIFEGNQRMVELVNSLLDVSRLDLGKLANEPSPNDISSLVEGLEKEMTVTIHDKQLKVINELQDNLDSVVADPKLMRMIVQNLVSNAVKYTPAKGSVTITARNATTAEVTGAQLPEGKPYMFFSVKDTGYGIPEAQQGKIFNKLFRADNVRALDVEGTGLGLYIVKEVTEKLGGRVWFESKESAGTTFYVVMPFVTSKTKA